MPSITYGILIWGSVGKTIDNPEDRDYISSFRFQSLSSGLSMVKPPGTLRRSSIQEQLESFIIIPGTSRQLKPRDLLTGDLLNYFIN